MKQRGMKILAMLLTLVLLVGLVPGMSLTAHADSANSYVGVALTMGESFFFSGEFVETAPGTTQSLNDIFSIKTIAYNTDTKCWEFGCGFPTGTTISVTFSIFGAKTPEPIGFEFVSGDGTKATAYKLALYYGGFIVTYDPGEGTCSGGELPKEIAAKDADNKYTHTIQSYEQKFTAPEGKTFDYWQGSDGKTYRPGPEVEISANLTLTAQWKRRPHPRSSVESEHLHRDL